MIADMNDALKEKLAPRHIPCRSEAVLRGRVREEEQLLLHQGKDLYHQALDAAGADWRNPPRNLPTCNSNCGHCDHTENRGPDVPQEGHGVGVCPRDVTAHCAKEVLNPPTPKEWGRAVTARPYTV
jgi:hypothetical protein